MKQHEETKTGMQTAVQYRRRRVQKGICIFLRILLILSGIICCWVIDLGCALGWIRNAKAGENWPLEFVGYGQMMIAASVFLTIGAVLVLVHRRRWMNWAGIGVGTVGILLCMIPLYRVSSYAADSGFYSKIMDMSADTLYRMEILPTLVVYGSLVLLALVQFFSLDARMQRIHQKHRESQKAPSVLEDSHKK
ncbi:MAG: hypothetical protein ACI4XB_03300 [Ruminococcus sp.]